MALRGKFRRFKGTQTKDGCNYFPKDKDELYKIIIDRVIEDPECDLNDVWTGDIEDMGFLFTGSNFNGDISRWDVSKVESMYAMFYNSAFEGDISSWDVGNVKDMRGMFHTCLFNGDISSWDVSNVDNMALMFEKCPLEKNPPKWYKDFPPKWDND